LYLDLHLEKLIQENQNNIFLKRKGKDKYNRTLGIIFIGKKINVNDRILENNICPPYLAKK